MVPHAMVKDRRKIDTSSRTEAPVRLIKRAAS